MKNIIFSFIAALALLASPVLAGSSYSEIFVFGDSLSDPGNVFVVTGEHSVRPFNADNIPDAPYARGGHHFSNGKTWIEQLSAELKLKGGTGPALRTSAFTNYAFGAARARMTGVMDLSSQVGFFLSKTQGNIPADALYSIYVGGNDVRDATTTFFDVFFNTGDPVAAQLAAEAVVGEAVQSIADNIMLLASLGATNFLVPNVPNIGVTPAIQSLGPQAVAVATGLSSGFNAALEATLFNLENGLGVQITRLNVFKLINDAVADPGIAGLVNVTEPCITPLVRKGAFCNKPDEYLFWDGIHPTRAAHAYLADAGLEALAQ
jgi:phospholipase/lecithinase/hemolysin